MADITYYDTYHPEQLDSAFYVEDSNVLASVSDGERRIGVFCVGEMRILFPEGGVENPTPDYRVLRYTSDLIEVGIDTDSKLSDFADYWLERGFDVWVNNSWFELRYLDAVASGEDLEWEVYYSIDEAVDDALRILNTPEETS
jgi:hypothetical protein